MKTSFSVGLVGARGHVGKELIGLIASHPNLTLQWVSSRRLAGQSLEAAFGIESALVIEDLSP